MRPLLTAALLLAWGATGFWAGDQYRNNSFLAQQASAQLQAKAALQAAQARGDALSAELLAQQDHIDQLKTESLHAITTSTTGRACLNSSTVRLLDSAPGITLRVQPGRLPPAPGSAAAADAAAARADADSAPASTPDTAQDSATYASDTDVSTWIVGAAAQYEVCRTRLDALIDWSAKP